MIGRVARARAELILPGPARLPLSRIDQVERDAREMALGERERGERFIGAVLAAERLEAVIVERLHPEREPVDAGGAVAGEALGLDAGRIRFERDLGVADRAANAWRWRRGPPRRLGLHQGGRAAAEEDTGDASPRRERSEMASSGEIRREETRFVDAAMADMRIKVAVRAFGATEGPVHINPESSSPRVGEGARASARAGEGAKSLVIGRLHEFLESAHAVRKRALLRARDLTERLRIAIRNEDRIIAETADAARRPGERTENLPLEDERTTLPERRARARKRNWRENPMRPSP